jgi:hypothetical protein
LKKVAKKWWTGTPGGGSVVFPNDHDNNVVDYNNDNDFSVLSIG